ncbi:nucleotide-diphospho-sugar transferase-domain-containing protein [Ostreococcus tauri]|uniref:Nucleotide-diphospho-sugar transferase-domain-containing protein n=1 Tax=Ostreococcus tauri TaxID=70448 RepID=A0A1Y5I2A0_OSTTA|nr:nucleotide-diphospho-sugar transferase-domain-containing protein [Ostreococcus tauri]
MMVGELVRVVDAGFHVALSDVDVAWTRDPTAYFLCERDVDGCEEIKDADVMISSDNLSPTTDWGRGARYARGGVFNTGVVYVKSSARGAAFLREWREHLLATTGPYAALTSHQQVFNKMVREHNAWPGIDVAEGASERTRVLESGAPLSTGLKIKIGALPLKLFANGHGYFVQGANARGGDREDDRLRPYAVHATYTFDGSGNDAKRYRFKEAGLWMGDDDDAATETTYLTFDFPNVDVNSTEPNIGDHVKVARANVRALIKAFAYAVALNRTLAIPPSPCRCDKVWGGHDNVFKAKCRYPGADSENYLPGVCPLDHFVSPRKIKAAGGDFVPLASVPPDAARAGTRVDWNATDRTIDAIARFDAPVVSLGSIDAAPELDVDAIRDRSARARALAVRRAASTPEPWCAECLPDKCARWIPAHVLALGAVFPARGGAQEMWCVDFTL